MSVLFGSRLGRDFSVAGELHFVRVASRHRRFGRDATGSPVQQIQRDRHGRNSTFPAGTFRAVAVVFELMV